MDVEDHDQALAYLRNVGAYRLKGYWHHATDPTTKRFASGYSFEDVRQRCEFDRELRAATTESIDLLEVAIRATIANHLSLNYSPHWFLDHRIFKPHRHQWGIGQMIRKVEEEVKRAEGKAFIKHYYEHHDDPYLPPSWAVSECVSFGMWSRTYGILRHTTDKRAIAARFGVLNTDVFQSWIHALTVLRNLAAHHGQLLNVQLGVAPMGYKRGGMTFRRPKSFFAVATVIQYLLTQTGLPHRWKGTLVNIMRTYPRVPPADVGFEPGWTTSAGW